MGRLDDVARLSITRLRGKADGDRVLFPAGVTYLASGFWIASMEGRRLFCTNRHNVDPSLKKTGLTLVELEIELRRADGVSTGFHAVTNLSEALWMHDCADCAIVVDPQLGDTPDGTLCWPLPETWLADQQHFEKLQIADEAFFLGFPGVGGQMWFDERATLPIARGATLASVPREPFTNQQIRTADTLMVAGLSFSGSSGSAVINRRQGIPPGGDIQDPSHVPSLIIGVMSGHFSAPEPDLPAALRHGGLSYLTRSTALRDLIALARSRGFRR
jgi:hypothetical protein